MKLSVCLASYLFCFILLYIWNLIHCYLHAAAVRSDRSETESEGLVIHSSRPASCVNSQVTLDAFACITWRVDICYYVIYVITYSYRSLTEI